jgi:hypothetical protein
MSVKIIVNNSLKYIPCLVTGGHLTGYALLGNNISISKNTLPLCKVFKK